MRFQTRNFALPRMRSGRMCAKSLTFAKHCSAAAPPARLLRKPRAPDRALAPAALNRIIRFSRSDVIICSVETPENWTTISSDTHFADDHLSVVTERVRTPHRTEPHTWTIGRRKSGVVVAAMTAEGNFVLIQQERIPIRKAIWEMPAGQVDQLCDF